MVSKCNVGLLEQVVRIVLGAILIVIAVGMISGVWQIISIALALFLWITAWMRYCPLTDFLGINTCEEVGKPKVVSVEGQKTKSKRMVTKKRKVKTSVTPKESTKRKRRKTTSRRVSTSKKTTSRKSRSK